MRRRADPASHLRLFRRRQCLRLEGDAESFLEPVDVEPDERAYDADGRLLHVVVRGEIRQGRWSVDQSRARVELLLAEEEPSHGDELRARLSEWLQNLGDEGPAPASLSLEQLVDRAAGHVRRGPNAITKACVIVVLSAVTAAWWWLTR